jgi:hypothetical protein
LGARLRPERGRKSFLLLFFKKEDLSLASCLHPIALTGRLALLALITIFGVLRA